MAIDFFRIILDESKKLGLKGIISVIVKIAVYSICLSPVFLYFLLYQKPIIKTYNMFIFSTLVLGFGCLLFLIVFISSKIYASRLLARELKANPNLTQKEKEDYYLRKSFIITTVFQGLLSILILVSYFSKNSSEIIIIQFNELFIVFITIIIYICVSNGLWIYHLIKFKVLDNKK